MITKLPIQTKEAPDPIGPYNQAIKAGDFIFVSGQIALDAATKTLVQTDLEAETHQVMKNVGAILAVEGLTYEHIVKSSIFIRDMDAFPTINAVYGSYFSGHFPARETVEVSRLPMNVNVEISVIAVAASS
jgi:2-iminobutanoate/2-iminopropanoate deaminase